MTWRRSLGAGVLAVALGLAALASAPLLHVEAKPLPDQLSNEDFWRLVEGFSEPSGYFQSDNLVSNEHTFQYVVPALQQIARPGRVYVGVAPDQNFTYMLALKPQLAFIVDIRRGNLHTQMMYKALIELSADRAEFLGRLFARPRPEGLTAKSTVDEIFMAYARTISDGNLQAETLSRMLAYLTDTRKFRLKDEDLRGIEDIYDQFVRYGPSITYSSGPGRMGVGMRRRSGGFSNFPSYADLMRQTDATGVQRGYLATEENFQALKLMEQRNLIVPIVGDFAGPKALRAVGRYIRDHGATIAAFYTSNVEQYLFRNGVWRNFYSNLSTLPVDDSSVIIRSVSPRDGYQGVPQGPDGRANVLDPVRPLVRDFNASKITSYYDVTSRVH
jgi:hypothetical protein